MNALAAVMIAVFSVTLIASTIADGVGEFISRIANPPVTAREIFRAWREMMD